MKKRLIALIVAMVCFVSNILVVMAENQASTDAAADEMKRRYLFNIDFNDYTTEDLSLDKNVKYNLNDGTVKIVNYVDIDPESYVGKVLQLDYDGETSNYACFPSFRYSLGESVSKGKITAEFDTLVTSASNDQFGFSSEGTSAVGASFSDRKIVLVNMDGTSDFILPAMQWVNIKLVVDFDEKTFSVIVDGEAAVDCETLPDTTPPLEAFSISAWPGGGRPMTMYFKDIKCYTEEVKKVKVDERDTAYTEPVGLLKGLGIIKDSDDYSLNAPVTRGHFAQLMTRSMGIVESNIDMYGETKYLDVGPENPYKRSVGYLDSLGWIHSADGKFHPDNTITFAQAAKWMTYLVGYDVLAEKKGGYPMGYISVLAELGVSNGMKLTSNTVMTEGDVYILLSKLLETEIIEAVSYGEKIIMQSSKDNTALWRYFNAYKIRGIVTATENTGLATEGGAVSEDYIQIDGKDYELGEKIAKDVIGKAVTAYIREDKNASGSEVVCLSVDNKRNKILLIQDDQINGVTESGNNFVVNYTDENERSKSVTLSKDAYYIYNGVAYGDVISKSYLETISGDVLCIDNDKDSDYDVVSINNYTYVAVKSVDSISELIHCQNGKSILADEDVLLWDGEKEIKLTELSEWDVLQVRETIKGKAELLLLTETVRGIVESVGDNEVTVNGVAYKISSCLTNAELNSIVLGEEMVAALDTRGRICVVNDNLANSDDIGYLIGVGADDGVLSGKTKVKLLTHNGAVNVYEVNKSFRYNDKKLSQINTVQKIDPVGGVVLDETENIASLSESEKLIKLLTVDSFKKQIANRTAESIQSLLSSGKINPDSVRQIVKYRVGKDKVITSIDTESLKVDKPVGYGYAYSYDQSGRIVCNYASIGTSGVPTFIIPPEGSDDEDYRAVDWASYGDSSDIYPEAYNMSPSLVPEAMLFYGSQEEKAKGDTLLIERSYVKLNEEGEYVHAFDLYERGVKKTYLAENDTIGENVHAGDIIKVALNIDKEIKIAEVFLRAADNPAFIQNLDTSAWVQFNYGVLMGAEKGGFAISTVNDGTATEPIPSGIIPFTLKPSTKVYLYDLTENKLHIGSYNDVANYTFELNPTARVAARAEAAVLTEVYIFFR